MSYSSRASSEVQGFITNSNLELLLNYEGLLDFPVLKSPLFYILISFSIVMLGLSIWSLFKDKAIDRDLVKFPQKFPSKIYRLMTYIICTHNFICILVLYEKKRPRVMRAVLYYTRILGVMTFSCIFNQTFQSTFFKKIALSIITVFCISPINFAIGYLIFKHNIQKKIRRKRMALQSKKAKNLSLEESNREKKNKARTITLNTLGYIFLITIILAYIYAIFVITANNIKKYDNIIVQEWLYGFVLSFCFDFFGVQIGKVFVHLGILKTLKNERKKKFLCIPRKHLPNMLSPIIFDYQKRFATLEKLYAKEQETISSPPPEEKSPQIKVLESPTRSKKRENLRNNRRLTTLRPPLASHHQEEMITIPLPQRNQPPKIIFNPTYQHIKDSSSLEKRKKDLIQFRRRFIEESSQNSFTILPLE